MKQRLDSLLVERGLASELKAAFAMIMAGEVSSNDRVLSQPGFQVDPAIELSLKTRSPYVSRGGDKLASVADKLGLNFRDKIVLDVGASTGGFTDYALQHGALKVYAVDVGHGQLDYRLRQDERVIVNEHMDIRKMPKLAELVDLVLIDVSFISLHRILSACASNLKPDGMIVAMVKPQFEASRVVATKFGGVINDPEIRLSILMQFEAKIVDQFKIKKWADSAVPGVKGNVERFYLLTKH